ncbi:glycosyltransferase family protein [Methylobacterium terricola]|uniref:glycosyltransferase family protein n=1 Tax=Methylobacterium terricola TaxID=2583531 RepID=UPI001FEBA746|nr:glycosyltransferase [Methylobacterium terricola]
MPEIYLGATDAGGAPDDAPTTIPAALQRRDRAAPRETPTTLPADFSPQGYRDCNPDLGALADHEVALHYSTVGKPAGLAYRADHVPGFDPDHFRETHPAFAHADDTACRNAWQAQGGPDATPGNQAAHLQRLGLALPAYPKAFPWRFYTRLYPRAAAHRWAALAHFLREGFAEVADEIPYGDDAPSFLIALGNHLAARGHPAAIRAYELAITRDVTPSPAARRRLAEAYGRAGAWAAALDLYDGLLDDLPEGDGAELREADLRGFVGAAARRAAWPRLFTRLPGALARLPAAGDAMAREVTESYFAERGRAARALYTEGRRVEGDAVLARAIRDVADLAAACLPAGTRAAEQEPFVAILAHGLPEGAGRRLDHAIILLGRAGHAVRFFDLGTVRAFEEALPAASAAIVVRMPAWPTVVQALVRARRLGVPTLYETDELTVAPAFAPPPLAAFEGRIGERAYEDLLFGVALYRGAAALCDHGLVPTRALARHLDGIVATGRSFVVRDAAEAAERSPAVDDRVRLFLHAPRTRILDAADPAGAALLHVLRHEPRVRLTTAGFIALDDAFAPFADRIDQRGPIPDWEEALAGCDLNLVLADGSEAEDCLAPTGWLAAARRGIPTLASDTPAHRETLTDGTDIRLAAGGTEWADALGALVAAPDLRATLGAAAARRAADAFSPEAAGEAYRALLAMLRSPTPR